MNNMHFRSSWNQIRNHIIMHLQYVVNSIKLKHSKTPINKGFVAERQGFEPWSEVNLNTISSRAPSASSAISPNKVLNYAKAILYKCVCNVNDIA